MNLRCLGVGFPKEGNLLLKNTNYDAWELVVVRQSFVLVSPLTPLNSCAVQFGADLRLSDLFCCGEPHVCILEYSNNCLAAFLTAYCVWQALLGRKQKFKY